MSSLPKLNAKQVELLLKFQLLQKRERLEKLKEIEQLPDDGSVDKIALMSEAVNFTGEIK